MLNSVVCFRCCRNVRVASCASIWFWLWLPSLLLFTSFSLDNPATAFILANTGRFCKAVWHGWKLAAQLGTVLLHFVDHVVLFVLWPLWDVTLFMLLWPSLPAIAVYCSCLLSSCMLFTHILSMRLGQRLLAFAWHDCLLKLLALRVIYVTPIIWHWADLKHVTTLL